MTNTARLSSMPPSALFDRCYRIVRFIGTEGSAILYDARPEGSELLVCLRVIPHDKVTSPRSFGAKFFADGARRVRLSHPSTVRVLRYGRTHDGDFFSVTEHPGELTLADALRTRGAVGPRMAVRVGLDLCGSLMQAHAAGVLHSRLRPSCVFVPDAELASVKLGGFGAPLERDGAGNPCWSREEVRYAAPEALRGEQLSARTDIYGIGALLYELASGCPPYDDSSAVRVLLRQQRGSPELQSTTFGAAFRAVVARCMRARPQERFASVAELADCLRQATLLPNK